MITKLTKGGIAHSMQALRIMTAVTGIAALVTSCSKSPSQSAGQQTQVQQAQQAQQVQQVQQVQQIPAPETVIQVRFLGITNDAAGSRQARFELRNVGSKPTDVSLPGFVDLGMRGGGYFGFTNTLLQAGASVETIVTAPTDRSRWRAEVLCTHSSGLSYYHIYSDYLSPDSL